MKRDLTTEEYQKLFNGLVVDFNELELEPEEVDEELREMGYDPEKVGEWGKRVAEEALKKYRERS